MYQFYFRNILHIDIFQNNLKGSKIYFPYDQAYHIVMQAPKLKFI